VAFGLATYLRAARWPRASVRRALLVFAAASPAAAGATFAALATAPALSSPAGIALCVLFSGGTFLYASCIHILARAAAPPFGSPPPGVPPSLRHLPVRNLHPHPGARRSLAVPCGPAAQSAPLVAFLR